MEATDLLQGKFALMILQGKLALMILQEKLAKLGRQAEATTDAGDGSETPVDVRQSVRGGKSVSRTIRARGGSSSLWSRPH